MNKDLKELIDSVDSSNQTHSDLESMVRFLKDEIQRLNFTINEQKRIIQTQNAKLSTFEESQVPEDVQILKELVLSQRDDMKKKDKDIEILQRMVEEISLELENAKQYNDDTDELNYANKIIVQLTEENENLQDELKILKSKVEQEGIQTVSPETVGEKEISEDNLQLVDLKKLVFQLQEENGISRVKIESLKAQVDKLEIQLDDTKSVKNQYFNELEESSQLIQELNEKMVELQKYNVSLEEKLAMTSQEDNEEKTEIIKDIRDKLVSLGEENSQLRINLEQASEVAADLEEKFNEAKDELNSFYSFFKKMYVKIYESEPPDEISAHHIGDIQNEIINRLIEFTELNTVLDMFKNQVETLESEIKEQEVDSSEIDSLENELSTVKTMLAMVHDEKEQLNTRITQLKAENESLLADLKLGAPSRVKRVDKISKPLFQTMYTSLNESDKSKVLDSLLRKVQQPNRAVKIHAIQMLSQIHDSKVYNALDNIVKQGDWLLKLYVIKSAVNTEIPEVKELLKGLIKDPDTDVREMAEKALGKTK